MTDFIKKRFFRHTLIYLMFAFLNRGLSFLLIPIFTRYLTPEDYGIYALFLTVVLVCEPLTTFCIHDAIGIVYHAQEKFKICSYVSTFIFFCAATISLQVVIIAILVKLNPEGFSISPLFVLAPLISFSYCISYVLGWMWQLQEKPVSFGRFNFFSVMSQLLLQIMAVVVLKGGWKGLLYAQSLWAIVIILLALVLLRKNKWLSVCFQWQCLQYGLKFGIALIPSVMASKLNESIGRLLIGKNYNLSQTGIYSLGQKLGTVVGVFSSSLNNAYRPWLLKKLANPSPNDHHKIIISVMMTFTSIAAVAVVGSVCMYLFSDLLLGQSFAGSLMYVFWAAAAYALNGMCNIITIFIYQTGKSWILSILTLSALGLNTLATWHFLNVFGLIGAAYAPVIAWAVTLALAIVIVIKLMRQRRV